MTEGDKEYQTIVLAAPLHDIGKLMQPPKLCVFVNVGSPSPRLNRAHALFRVRKELILGRGLKPG